MTPELLTALLSGAGTLIGSIGGILAANKLTRYRLDRLEEKVEKHNNVIERTFKLEGRVTELEHDVIDLKERNRK